LRQVFSKLIFVGLFVYIIGIIGFITGPNLVFAQTAADLEFRLTQELRDVLSQWKADGEEASPASRRAALARRLIFLSVEKFQSGDLEDNEVVKNHFNLPEGRKSIVAIFREVLKTEMARDPLLMGLYERALGKANEFRRVQGASDQSIVARKDIVYDLQVTALSLAAAGISSSADISDWVREETTRTHGNLGLALSWPLARC